MKDDYQLNLLKTKLDQKGYPSYLLNSQAMPLVKKLLMDVDKAQKIIQTPFAASQQAALNALYQQNSKLQRQNLNLRKQLMRTKEILQQRRLKQKFVPKQLELDLKFLYELQKKQKQTIEHQYRNVCAKYNDLNHNLYGLHSDDLLKNKQYRQSSLKSQLNPAFVQSSNLFLQNLKAVQKMQTVDKDVDTGCIKKLKQMQIQFKEILKVNEFLQKKVMARDQEIARLDAKISTTSLNIEHMALLSTIQSLNEQKDSLNSQLNYLLNKKNKKSSFAIKNQNNKTQGLMKNSLIRKFEKQKDKI